MSKIYYDKQSLKSIYLSFFHSYLYKLLQLSIDKQKQKHAVGVLRNESKCVHSKSLMRNIKVLNIYQINIFQILKLMHKHKLNANPKIFSSVIDDTENRFPTKSNYKEPKLETKTASFVMIYEWPCL